MAYGLVRAGAYVHILSAAPGERRSPRRRSLMQTASPAVKEAGYLPAVGAVVAQGGYDHVIPMTEAVYRRVWDGDPPWIEAVFPSTAGWQRSILRNKYNFCLFMAERGVVVPSTKPASSPDELRSALESLGYPTVVKGVTGVSGAMVRIAHTEQDAIAAVRELRSVTQEEPFLQQYVDGPTYLAGGLFDRGRPIRLYATKMVQTYPLKTGPSIRHRTTADPALTEAIVHAMGVLQWSGLAEGDFVRGSDGTYHLMEINPRPWASIAAASAAGVDLFGPYAALLRGHRPRVDLSFRPDVESVVFPQYIYAQLRIHGFRNPRGWMRLLGDPLVWRSVPWARPALTAHLARWLMWRWSSRSGEPV